MKTILAMVFGFATFASVAALKGCTSHASIGPRTAQASYNSPVRVAFPATYYVQQRQNYALSLIDADNMSWAESEAKLHAEAKSTRPTIDALDNLAKELVLHNESFVSADDTFILEVLAWCGHVPIL